MSRLGLGVYRRFPFFGTLRASVAVIPQGQHYLAIRRNDGRGFSFPGGLAMPWESDEQALQREVAEETGLQLTAIELALRYYSAADVPCNISVFRAQAIGQLRGSWEGDPEWVAISDLRFDILRSQFPIVEKVLSVGAV
ncbi:MAG: NUDIX domain-containing protein [Terriglobales bacterium]